MDLQKEREVLQRLINEMNDVTNTWSVEQMVTHVWKQAKAQAVPEGYAVVPVEPKQETIKQMNRVWFESNCAHIMKTKTAELLYKAMIEAQELTND